MKNFFITLIVSILVTTVTFFTSPFVLGSTTNNLESSGIVEQAIDDSEGNDEGSEGNDEDSEGDDSEEEVEKESVKKTPEPVKVVSKSVKKDPKPIKVAKVNPSKPRVKLKGVTVTKGNFLSLLNDFKKWAVYNKANIEFSYDFTPLDVSGEKISKKDFLEKQTTGKFIASKKENLVYQLNEVPVGTNTRIVKMAKGHASTALYCLNQEGRNFPKFKVKDIKGNVFSKDLAKGKLLVIKCWFVQCLPCVKEFPELNHIYDKYESSENIEFLSFAFDKEEKIKKFLVKKEFRYPVLPEQKNFITKAIKARKYPLHILVGKDGKILKMFNNVNVLEHFIEKYK